MTVEQLRIASRFNGPPGSGNGGYICGLLMRHFDGASEVTLRAPPPLETPLDLSRDGDVLALRHGDTLLAEARACTFELTPPPAPTLAQAEAAAKNYVGLHNHRYPTCFTCGTQRTPRDGLEVFTGNLAGRAMVAAPWTPGDDLADESGRVRGEFIHAALDCPSYWALPRAGAMPALLARMRARIDAPRPQAGEALIVIGWPLSSDGRKHQAATALFTADGALLARTQALWIEPKSG